jgi:hypothetical protein
MLTTTDEVMTPKQAISCLVADAKEFAEKERRSETRFPFFRHASVDLDGHFHAVYTRNISDSGIGLMHTMDLPLCGVELCIMTDVNRILKLRARVVWCEPCSSGLYVSGLTFI